jgi:hypothetical protein
MEGSPHEFGQIGLAEPSPMAMDDKRVFRPHLRGNRGDI